MKIYETQNDLNVYYRVLLQLAYTACRSTTLGGDGAKSVSQLQTGKRTIFMTEKTSPALTLYYGYDFPAVSHTALFSLVGAQQFQRETWELALVHMQERLLIILSANIALTGYSTLLCRTH